MTKCYRCLKVNPAEVHTCTPKLLPCKECGCDRCDFHVFGYTPFLECSNCKKKLDMCIIEQWNKANEIK